MTKHSSLLICLFFFSVRFLSLPTADSTLNKGSARELHSKFGPAPKLTFEDNFQQKRPIGTDAVGHGTPPPAQAVPPFEDSFSIPLSAHAVPQAPQAKPKSDPRANLFLISSSQPLPTKPYNCVGKRDGIYLERDGTCAQTFWGCSNGKAFPYGCPRGLFYNVGNGQCDHRANVVACGGDHSQQKSQLANPSASSDKSVAPFNCSAKRDGLYAVAHCASDVFFACLGGRAVSMSVCSAGLKFDQQQGECAFTDQCGRRNSSSAESSQAKEDNSVGRILVHGTSNYYFGGEYAQRHEKVLSVTNFNCSGKPNGAYEKHFCASSFFKCTNGIVSEANCATNLVYDAKRAQCAPPQICWQQKSTNWRTDQWQKEHPIGGGQTQHSPQPMAPYQQAAQAHDHQPMAFQALTPQPPSPVGLDCVGKADGHYLPRPCQPTYFVCSNGAPVQMHCPEKLLFDPTKGACEYADGCAKNNAAAPPGGPLPPSSAPSVVGTAASLPRHPPSQAQNWHVNCSSKANGHYGQGHCLPNFVHCFNGLSTPQSCHGGLVYDEITGICEHPQKCGQSGAFPSPPQHSRPLDQHHSLSTPPLLPTAAPPRRPIFTQSAFRCRGRVDGYYFKKACTPQFFTCVVGHPIQLTCPGQLVFDPSRALCQYAHACNFSANAPGKPTTPGALRPPVGPPQPPPPATDFHCGGKRNGYYVRRPCIDHFYTCLGERATKFACPGQLVFDMHSLSCQHAENCADGADDMPRQQNPSPSLYADTPLPPRQLSHHLAPTQWHWHAAHQTQQQPFSTASFAEGTLPTPTQSPPPSATIGSTVLYRNSTSPLPPDARNGRRLPPRPAHQLLHSPSIDHSPSGGFCATPRKSDGLYSVPSGCATHFYACTAGITAQMDCPLGLFYDAALRQCNHRENVASCGGGGHRQQQQRGQQIAVLPLSFVAASATQMQQQKVPNWHNASSARFPPPASSNASSPEPKFNCSGRAIGYYSDGCSSEYFSCTGLNTYAFACPALLKYSELAGQCDYENNVPECGGTVPAPPPPPVVTNANATQRGTTTANPSFSPPQPPNPTKHPQHPANNPCGQLPNGTYGPKCSPYYMICSDGVPQDFLCQDEFVFHSPIGKCLPRQQISDCRLTMKN